MPYSSMRRSKGRLFQLFLPWLLLKKALLLGLGVVCFQYALTASPIWWVVVALIVVLAVRTILRFNGNSLTVGETHIVCRQGMLIVRVQSLPLWDLKIGCKQDLLGRLFNYGTIYLKSTDHTIQFDQVACVSELHSLVTKRQARLMLTLTQSQRQLLTNDHYRTAS